jgi:hypothetical protein
MCTGSIQTLCHFPRGLEDPQILISLGRGESYGLEMWLSSKALTENAQGPVFDSQHCIKNNNKKTKQTLGVLRTMRDNCTGVITRT